MERMPLADYIRRQLTRVPVSELLKQIHATELNGRMRRDTETVVDVRRDGTVAAIHRNRGQFKPLSTDEPDPTWRDAPEPKPAAGKTLKESVYKSTPNPRPPTAKEQAKALAAKEIQINPQTPREFLGEDADVDDEYVDPGELQEEQA